METTLQMILFYIVLPLVGVALMVFAFVFGKRLCQRPVDFGLTKLGFKLTGDAFTFLVLLGFVMAMAGGYLNYQQYETKVAGLESKLELANAELSTVSNILDGFRAYAVRFHLCFPEEDSVDVEDITVQAYIAKGDGQSQLYDPETMIGFSDDLWVKIDNLSHGDKLNIVAFDSGDKSWESSGVIEVPKSRLEMRRAR
ncbi:MAG: hypothetical protein JSU69_06255 [Candidatus Zixiibacteriota bacterium]|nr:MAG: hypothetical protein JSU69_06255 [candidate division Zixibacteria bacterium]